MLAPLYTRKQVLLAGIEALPGVDPVLTAAANGVLVQNLKFKPNLELLARDKIARPSLSQLPHLIGKLTGEISCDVELRGSGDASLDVPPDYGVLLRACGIEETIVAGTSVSYAFRSENFETVTIYCYLDGQLQKFLGCMGDFKLAGENAKPGLFSFTMKGLWGGAVDAALVFPAWQNLHPPLCKAVTFAYGGWSAPLTKWEIAAKNTVVERPSQNATYGVAEFLITERKPEASFDPEMQLLAQRDVWANLISVHEAALTIALGATPGNQVAISAPQCAKTKAEIADRSGLANYALTVGLYDSTPAGDAELTIAFT